MVGLFYADEQVFVAQNAASEPVQRAAAKRRTEPSPDWVDASPDWVDASRDRMETSPDRDQASDGSAGRLSGGVHVKEPRIAVEVALAFRAGGIHARVHAVREEFGSLVGSAWAERTEQVVRPGLAERTEQAETLARRAAKRASLHALHEVLSALTGRAQPWGILTGVRPTKLAHAHLRRAAAAFSETPDGIAAELSGGRRDRPVDAVRGVPATGDVMCPDPLPSVDGLAFAMAARDLERDYLVSPRRARLALEVAQHQLRVVPDLHSLSKGSVSVYLGVPFCPTHCAYCTFPAYSMREKAAYAEDFLAALDKEIRAVGELLNSHGVGVTSVYVGGGTPTSLRAPELRRVLESLLRHLPAAGSWREFCVEAGRADTITPDRVSVMRELGVDRVSVNPQTFNAATLRAIGRGHSPEIVDKRFFLFREAGFTNINMDLILGLPGEDVSIVEDSVRRTLRLQPDSVTLHTLSFKRSAAVTGHRDEYAIPADETVVAMMDFAGRAVEAAGLKPYYLYRQKDILANLENVGYAHPGKESVYNISIIQEAETIVAIGGGGASKWVLPGGLRAGQHKNPRDPRAYVETIDAVLEVKLAALRRVCEAIRAVSTQLKILS